MSTCRSFRELASVLVVSIIGGCAVGCGTRSAPAPVPPKVTKATAAKPVDPPIAAAAAAPNDADSKAAAVSADDSAKAAVAKAAPTEPPPPTFSTERVLLLTPQNPLLVEIQFSIDGLPHTQALAQLVEEVLKIADTDSDGRPTWKEVVESKRFKYGQFGNVAINNENDLKQVLERYDSDRDSAVDAAELPRFLTRNAGSARAFSVRGLADFTSGSRASPLWTLLDADDDGAISADERTAAAGRLASRDTDDDEIVLTGDVNARVGLDQGMTAQRRRGGITVIRLLGPHADWDSVRSSLEGRYGGSRYIEADAFPLTPELFAQLDKNQDGKLLKTEFPGLNDVPPHIVLAVSFGQPAKATNDAPAKTDEEKTDAAATDTPAPPVRIEPQIRLVKVAPELSAGQPPITSQAGRLTLRVGGTPITFYLNDTVAGGDYGAQAQQALMALDADKNGYLEEKEVPANAAGQLGQFAAVDANEDAKIYPDEIVIFLKQQQAGLRAQIHARASDRDDALFASLDQDHDERLDASEIEAVPERLAQLDANQDGEITDDEVPLSLAVGLARGNLENLDALFVPPPVIARAPAEGTPRWFTSMDANADGAISSREFLGPRDKFVSLDTSGDGLVDVAEARTPAQ